MTQTERFDQRIRQLVEEAVVGVAGEDDRGRIVAAVLAKLEPSFGAAAQRRRLVSELRAAYKDGYMTGRLAGKFSRWHGEIWNRSQTALRLRRPAAKDAEADARFARYNFD
jgi:hypothetical protein